MPTFFIPLSEENPLVFRQGEEFASYQGQDQDQDRDLGQDQDRDLDLDQAQDLDQDQDPDQDLDQELDPATAFVLRIIINTQTKTKT